MNIHRATGLTSFELVPSRHPPNPTLGSLTSAVEKSRPDQTADTIKNDLQEDIKAMVLKAKSTMRTS